jgi:hypothetical protein
MRTARSPVSKLAGLFSAVKSFVAIWSAMRIAQECFVDALATVCLILCARQVSYAGARKLESTCSSIERRL